MAQCNVRLGNWVSTYAPCMQNIPREHHLRHEVILSVCYTVSETCAQVFEDKHVLVYYIPERLPFLYKDHVPSNIS